MDSTDQALPDGPPADPEDWTDDEWIEWLTKTDAQDAQAARRPVTALGRITRSAGGSVVGQAMLGMAYALSGREQSEIVIVADGSSQPENDEPFAVRLDRDHPERSVVAIRTPKPTRSASDDANQDRA